MNNVLTGWEMVGFLWIAVASLADHVSTNVFLKRGILEGNEFLRRIIGLWGTTGLFIAKQIGWGVLLVIHVRVERLPLWLLFAIGLVFAVVCAYNLSIMRKRGVL